MSIDQSSMTYDKRFNSKLQSNNNLKVTDVTPNKQDQQERAASNYMSPRDRMKARNAQLEQDKNELMSESQNRSNKLNKEEDNDSINQPPTDRDFENDAIRQVNNNSK
jgi:hypothetical protein